jgi:hypothetical protein
MPFDPRQHLIKLKGRDYLPVAARLIWLNEESERYRIETQFLKLEDTYAVVQATVSLLDDTGVPTRSATALKREDLAHFADFLEKSETGAIGRALGMLGFGTQFAPEFDELEGKVEARVVDSPRPASEPAKTVSDAPKAAVKPAPKAAEAPPETQVSPSLAAAGLKPASSLGPPTNKRKPVHDDEPEVARPSAATDSSASLDIDDGLEEYDHSAVPDEDLFSETKVRRLLAIGGKLFNLKGDPLETRLLEAASKILGKGVEDLNALHWKDGNKVMQALEDQAIKRGVWDAPKN